MRGRASRRAPAIALTSAMGVLSQVSEARPGAPGLWLDGEGWVLWSYSEVGVEGGGGVFAGPDVECGGFDRPLFRLRAPELQFVFAQRELKGLSLAGFEGDALEAFELAHGTRGR